MAEDRLPQETLREFFEVFGQMSGVEGAPLTLSISLTLPLSLPLPLPLPLPLTLSLTLTRSPRSPCRRRPQTSARRT